MTKHTLRLLCALALVVFIVSTVNTLIDASDRSHEEVVQRQIEVEQHLQRLDNITTQIAGQQTEQDRRLELIERMNMPVVMAQIQKTIEFDHTLMWAVFIMVITIMIERIGALIVFAQRRMRNNGAGSVLNKEDS